MSDPFCSVNFDVKDEPRRLKEYFDEILDQKGKQIRKVSISALSVLI